jgi:outer membrane receptor for ferrienterochelin and colicin
VEATQDLIEEKIDRTVYNAEKDNTIKGGTALDALRRVPLLSVDAEGNVSLRGSSSLKVLLNNKPSSILAANLAEALKQIPAEQIQSVEVITSPSARYEAEGVTGIINIITKKNKALGYNMGFHCALGLRNASAGLNGAFKTQKLGIALCSSGGIRFNEWGRFENSQQTVLQKGESFSVLQQAQTRRSGSWGYNSLELDYELNKYHYINASIGLNLGSHNSFQDELLGQTFRDGQLVEKTLRSAQSANLYNIKA